MPLTLPDSALAHGPAGCPSSGKFALAFTFAIALLLSTEASTQQIYRCGTLYSQFPCEGAKTVDALDKRSPEQKTQIDEATRKTRQTADRMEQARLLTEKKQAEELSNARRAENARLAAVASAQRLAEAKEKSRLLKEKQALAKAAKLRKVRSPDPAPAKPQP